MLPSNLPALPAPRLLFCTAFPLPVWRLWPAPGALAVELRDQGARAVSFVVLRAADGHELFRYHDPAVPWWLCLTGLTATELLLTEMDAERLGQPISSRRVAWQPTAAPDEEPAARWLTPVNHLLDGPYFGPLATFIEALTDQRPATSVAVLETPDWTVLGFVPASADPPYELLVVRPDGTVGLCAPLGGAPTAPEEPRFCTFGPILYALGAPGEVLAWQLPTL